MKSYFLHCSSSLLIFLFLNIKFSIVNSFQIRNFRFHRSYNTFHHALRTKQKQYTTCCKNSVIFASSNAVVENFGGIRIGQQLIDSLCEASQQRLVKPFLKSLSLFSAEINRSHQRLANSEKFKLISLINNLFPEFEAVQVATVLLYLADCGFTVFGWEASILKDLETMYLQRLHSHTDLSVVIYFKALSNLGFGWTRWDDNQKESYLVLFEEALKLELSRGQYRDFMVSISKIGIPWTSMSESSQKCLLQKMAELVRSLDPVSKARVIHAFASIQFIHFTSLSQSAFLVFLEISKECLEFNSLEGKGSFWGRQVKSLFFRLFFINVSNIPLNVDHTDF
jgi:hypothetical protein